MILDVTYKCRRKQTKVVPMKPESIRGVIKNYIVYDEADPSEAFSVKCAECKFSEPGVRITHGPAGARSRAGIKQSVQRRKADAT